MDWVSIPWTRWLFNFAFFYPIVMAFFWMTGGLYYYVRRERGTPRELRRRNAVMACVVPPLIG